MRQWLPALLLGGTCATLAGLLVFADPNNWVLPSAVASTPRTFGLVLFQKYWFAIEITSLLLLVALIGAFYLGSHADARGNDKREVP